jgi:hypothetical protein
VGHSPTVILTLRRAKLGIHTPDRNEVTDAWPSVVRAVRRSGCPTRGTSGDRGRSPYAVRLFAQKLGWRHLGHRQSALVGQAAAVNAELNYLMATAREHDLLDNDTWSRFFFTSLFNAAELLETLERFTGSFGPDDPEGQAASSRGPELRAPIETMLARLQA